MREMPKHLNLMPPHTHNVNTTPDAVSLIAVQTALVVTPAAATATTLATLAVTPSAVGPTHLQHRPPSTPYQFLPLPSSRPPPLPYNTGCHPETDCGRHVFALDVSLDKHAAQF